ncbi:CopD family protein [Pseudonocardia sp. TMWB2A]|uniref:CopD family protein n=1 Tax=Pseudonocardia sp. TMWB2A TaxID=687430 RepID=UPI00307F9AD3
MTGFLGSAYLWIKAAHIIFVIFLMAGLFMMPRFFVYQQQSAAGSPEDTLWNERNERLRKIILMPSIILVWVLGLMLAAHLNLWSDGWFHAKLLFVLVISAYHGWIVRYAKALKRGERKFSEKKLRMWNEIPGLIAVVTVILVVVRPF